MKTPVPFSRFVRLRLLLSLLLGSAGMLLGLLGAFSSSSLSAQPPTAQQNSVAIGASYHNDVSPPLRSLPAWLPTDVKADHEANENPKVPRHHRDSFDPVIQSIHASTALGSVSPSIAATLNNFDGIPFPGVGCNCAPPDTNGAIGKRQYVQIVNEGYQVFDEATEGPLL